MKDRLINRFSVLEVLDDDSLQQRGGDLGTAPFPPVSCHPFSKDTHAYARPYLHRRGFHLIMLEELLFSGADHGGDNHKQCIRR